jgi:hypothetical protein
MDKEDYTHWFWNSAPVDWFAQALLTLDAWLYDKQYGTR